MSSILPKPNEGGHTLQLEYVLQIGTHRMETEKGTSQYTDSFSIGITHVLSKDQLLTDIRLALFEACYFPAMFQ